MAKQNFLSGGYYGKLGATVGQRWKNIRTIRTYVIPHNPKTPKQQANRKKFGAVVPYAQLGQQTNYGSVLFRSSSTTEWALRMKTAIANANAGLTDVGIVPLYPADFIPTYTITGINITSITNGTSFEATLEGDLPEYVKKYSLLLHLAGAPKEYEYLVCVGTSHADDVNAVTFVNPHSDLLANYQLTGKIVSLNDDTADTVVCSGKLNVSYQGGNRWTWEGAEVSFEITDDADIRVILKKDGLGDGSFTGDVEVVFTEGTFTVNTETHGSKNLTFSDIEYADVNDFHDNSQNILVLANTYYDAFPNVDDVLAIQADLKGEVRFTNYKQNGYENTLTGAVAFEMFGEFYVD